MAELSKLLAFMFKEDKEDILAQYNKMLDESDDEQALLESFGSPTKLAVTISRTYKRSERKLAVEADSKEDKSAETEHIFVTPVKKEKTAEVNTGLSYADIIEEIRREKAEEEGVEYKPMFFDEPEQPAAEETVQPEPETEEDGTQIASDEESTVVEPETEAPVSEETENEEKSDETAPEEETQPEEADEADEKPAEEAASDEAPVIETTEADRQTEETETAETGEKPADVAHVEDSYAPELVFEELESIELPEETTRYKTNVALLILYLIFAIPISAVLIVLALAVAVVLVALGVSLITIGVEAIGFAFAKLVIFADIMLCAGAVLIAFAVALILLWIGVLVLVRGISGIVRGAKALGRSFCVKEVPDNE
ncbi:MAG: hypothetical protein U0N60_08250 [Oscillospiraceae bacterium]